MTTGWCPRAMAACRRRRVLYKLRLRELGHPVLRLYLFLGIDARLESLELLGRFGALACSGWFIFLIKTLCVHVWSSVNP